MKKYAPRQLLFLCIVSSTTLFACNPKNVVGLTQTPATTANPTETKPIIFLTPTHEPTLNVTPTRFFPTVNPIQEQSIKTLLLDESCILPCYLGITPGKTTTSMAKQIIQSLGGTLENQGMTENGDQFTKYHLNLSVAPKGLKPEEIVNEDYRDALFSISHQIEIVSSGEEVKELFVKMSSASTDEEFQKAASFWERYTMSGILQQLGGPDSTHFLKDTFSYKMKSGQEILLDYKSEGVLFHINGSNSTNNICIKLPSSIFDLNFALFSPKSYQYIEDVPMKPYYFDKNNYWTTTEDALGVSDEEFFNKILRDPTTCFNLK